MKFKIKIQKIQKILKKLNTLTPTVSHRPELTGIVIDVYDTRVVFEIRNDYLDSKIEISDLNEVLISEKGRMLVKARILNEIIQMMNGDFVEFIKVEDNLLVIKSQDSQYEVNLMNVERFEKANFAVFSEDNEEIIIKAKKFKKIINKVIFAGDEYASRRILQGINFLFNENSITSIATDGVRIALKREEIKFNKNLQKIIPIKTLKEIYKIIDDNDEISINFTKNKLVIFAEDIVLQTKIIEGTFPDVVSIFPKEFKNRLEINKQELVDLINRTTLLSMTKAIDNIYIKIIIVDSLLKFEAREIEIGYANISTKNYSWDGEAIYQIAFNPRYLLEALKVIEVEKVEIFFNENQQPFVVKGKNDNSFKTLILPFKT